MIVDGSRLCGLFLEVEMALKAVQVRAGQQFFVLEASDNNAWGNAELGGEELDGLVTEASLLTKGVDGVFGDEEV